MSEIDTAEEWRRLQEIYRDMSEEELQGVADEGYELTDIAKQALQAEISRRGLQVMVRLTPPKEEEQPPAKGDYQFNPADLDLRTVVSVENRDEAEWVKATLNDTGILCLFHPGFVEDVEKLEFSRYPGFGVMVLHTDIPRARDVLRGFDAHFGKEKGAEEERDLEVRCPKCNSNDVMLKDVEDSETGEQATFNWSCEACGHHWHDDGNETG